MAQTILSADAQYTALDAYLTQSGVKCLLLVCDASLQYLRIRDYFDTLPARLGIRVVRFSDFQPNPLYASVEQGVARFRAEQCDLILAVGGGSAIDVAKCIKLYAKMDAQQSFLQQTIVPNTIPLFAVPTTAGTGSEATRYAVIYDHGEKQSIADQSCIPSTVLFDESVLQTLPPYQKKATMLDAYCHAIESFWSVNSTDESKGYAKEAIALVQTHQAAYLSGDASAHAAMLKAANLAGKAINVTQTTAGHAMCYKLTSLYGIAHGHAAALCLTQLFPYMCTHLEDCIDQRGVDALRQTMQDLAAAMGCETPEAAAARFCQFVAALELPQPRLKDVAELRLLQTSVNPVRLKNHPIALDTDAILQMYQRILQGEAE